ncbi:MAG TPA: restriction endonuclease subunit S, partial [Candidatus Brocadiaceae bacterium]
MMVDAMKNTGFKKTAVGIISTDWEVTRLSELSNMKSGETITSKRISEIDIYPCYGGNGLRGYTSDYTHNGDFALIGRQGALCGNVQFVNGKFYASEHAVVVTPKVDTDIKWLYYMLVDMNLNQYSESSAQPGLSVAKILKLPITLPPTKAEQTAIATALNDADKLITELEKLIAK